MEELRRFCKNGIGISLLVWAVSFKGAIAAINCVQCVNQTSEADCNMQGIVSCIPSDNRCKTDYKSDFTLWSKSCSSAGTCVAGCVGDICTDCCNGDTCNTIANVAIISTTPEATSTITTTTVSLSLSTGEQMAFLYIVFILIAPIVISAIAAACWLVYFRSKRRTKKKKEEKKVYDTKHRKNAKEGSFKSNGKGDMSSLKMSA